MALFQILVDISADTAKLVTGLDRAQTKIDSFANSIKRAAQTAGLIYGIEQLASSIDRAIDAGARLQLLSDRMGASVKSLSQLQYAAALTDVPVEALTASLDHFHTVVTRAEIGSGRAGKALAALGIDAKKLLSLPFDEQLAAIADRLTRIQNPAERAGYEMIFFGGEGAKLDPLLRQGAAGIQRLREEAEKAGVTIDGSLTEKLKDTHEALIRMNATVSKSETVLAGALAPAISSVAGWFVQAVHGIQDFGEALAHYFHGADTPAGQLQDRLSALTTKSLALNNEIMKLEQRSSGILGYPGQYDAQIAARKRELNEISVQIQQVTAQLQQAERDQKAADRAKNKPADVDKTDPYGGLHEIHITAQKIYTDRMTSLLESYNKDTETAEEKALADFNRQTAELEDEYARREIDAAEYARRMNEIVDRYLPGVKVTAHRVKTKIQEQTDEMQAYADQAAASIQGAFANFLFDPFHNSAKRMAQDFLRALQKMAADAAAAGIFKSLFGGSSSKKSGDSGGLGDILGSWLGGTSGAGSWISSLFGGSSGSSNIATSGVGDMIPAIAGAAAGGGDVAAGSTYLVGEQGPELFTAASHGRITPNDEISTAGDFNFSPSYHIDASGADADRIMTILPPLMGRLIAQSKADMLHAFRRHGLPAPTRA